MKITALFLMLLGSSAYAHSLPAQEEDNEPQVCTAILSTPEVEWQLARVECDSPYAGKCLKQVKLADGSFDWEEIKCE